MRWILPILMLLFHSACGHVIRQEFRDRADDRITAEVLFRDPESHIGKTVILGGIIVDSRNAKEGTYLEVVQKPLDRRGRPEDTDRSAGRFLILHEGYLDTAVFTPGRKITVAGEVMGKSVRPLDEIEYPYTLIKSREVRIIRPGRVPFRFSIGVGATF